MRRVVVTGMGMVTPVGRDLEKSWTALQEGKSGVGRISLFDAASFPTKIAAEVSDFQLSDYVDDAGRWADHCRNTKFAIAAARMAFRSAPGTAPEQVASRERRTPANPRAAPARGEPPVP